MSEQTSSEKEENNKTQATRMFGQIENVASVFGHFKNFLPNFLQIRNEELKGQVSPGIPDLRGRPGYPGSQDPTGDEDEQGMTVIGRPGEAARPGYRGDSGYQSDKGIPGRGNQKTGPQGLSGIPDGTGISGAKGRRVNEVSQISSVIGSRDTISQTGDEEIADDFPSENPRKIPKKFDATMKPTAVQPKSMFISPLQEVIYVNCDSNLEIAGIKLSSLINFVFENINVKEEKGNGEEYYSRYCNALEQKLGAYEPYSASLHVKEKNQWKIVDDMKQILPHNVLRFDRLIEKAAENAVAILANYSMAIDELYNRQTDDNLIASEFVVMKVFHSGDNLEIIPCYMGVKTKKINGKNWMINWSKSETHMEYMQQKYFLSKFDIQEIVGIIKDEPK